MGLLKSYDLSIQIDDRAVVVQFLPVAASATRKYILLIVGVDAIGLLVLALAFRQFVGFIIPLIIVYSAWWVA